LTWDRIARKSPAAITFGIRTTSVIGISARVGGSGAYPKPRELTESEENELSTLRQEYNGLVARHKEPDNAKFGERMDKIDKRVAELSVKEYDPAEVVEAYAVITMEYSGEVKVRRPREEGKEIGGAVAQARPNWAGDGSRPLAWSAWYPTEDVAHGAVLSEEAVQSSFVAAEAIGDARLASRQETYPVVLLSHGTGGTAASLGWLGQRLAKAGFVTIGVDHHGNTASEDYRPEGFLCWWERARDLTVLLDLHSAEGQFAGRLDCDRIFAAGFSLGGYTVLSLLGAITKMPLFLNWSSGTPWGNGPREFPNLGGQFTPLLETSAVFRASWNRQSSSYKDRRIKAALLCAPAPTVRGLTVESLEEIAVPVAIAAVGADRVVR
jgi:esterase/lipase